MTRISFAKSNIPNSGKDTAKLIDIIVNSIQEKKGHDVVSLDLRKSEGAICDFFIICHGNSTTQVMAIANFVDKEVYEKHGDKPWSKEGYGNRQWVLLDYVNVVVHVFMPETRKFYDVESLWEDGDLKIIKEKRKVI
ncbi:MAG TPA: ribosome silencing factor [Flavobacteriales bacterium]|nr:ribosome silencing factor [Flavobacteriales bacterium]HIN38802.1 ribosome silencing factor [Flavobacteriales bacterium]